MGFHKSLPINIGSHFNHALTFYFSRYQYILSCYLLFFTIRLEIAGFTDWAMEETESNSEILAGFYRYYFTGGFDRWPTDNDWFRSNEMPIKSVIWESFYMLF